MIYAKAFFDLQLDFATAVTALSGRSLASVLMDYTNLYIRLGLGRDFDSAHPTWQEYVRGLTATNDPRKWTYRFFAARAGAMAGPAVEATSGCFAYSRLSEERIRLHFQNVETDSHSPLGADRIGRRRAELAALFEPLPRPVRVVGASWLYNLEAYRRLFPPSYLASSSTGEERSGPAWRGSSSTGSGASRASTGSTTAFRSRCSRSRPPCRTSTISTVTPHTGSALRRRRRGDRIRAVVPHRRHATAVKGATR